jgi:MFS family permease
MSDVNSIDRAGPGDRRRWLILGVIGLAQLMVVLDVTVMNIALPSAQRALHFTTADRQWVVTAYTLAFGSLLLLGGRLADLLGRKVTFLIGLLGFAGVSAIGGASVNFGMLITARACQGAFGAILVPSALSLLTTTFTEPKERGKAFGIYGAIAAAGGAIGLLLSGANADGAEGLARIRQAGGLTMVQDPEDATVGYMPQQAIALTQVDYIARTVLMAEIITRVSS